MKFVTFCIIKKEYSIIFLIIDIEINLILTLQIKINHFNNKK